MKWQEMSRDQKIAVVRKHLDSGLSAGAAAAEIGWVSRNAIIGFAARNGIALRSGMKGGQRPATAKVKPAPRPPMPPRPRPPVVEPVEIRAVDVWKPLPDAAPIGLMELAGSSCRWPVEGGYCGCAVQRGSYCAAHGQRAYRAVRA